MGKFTFLHGQRSLIYIITYNVIEILNSTETRYRYRLTLILILHALIIILTLK